MDYYLVENNAFARLVSEYEEHKSLVVAYDFDNTVFDYHSKGHDYSMVIKLLRDLKEVGCYLIVFTANKDVEFVEEYCLKQKIPFDAINDNPPFFKSNSRKIYYNILLDDRAGLLQSYNMLNRLLDHLSSDIK